MAGNTWVGPQLQSGCARALGHALPPALMSSCIAYRAGLRAQLAIAHRLDAQPRTPQKWAPLAQRYVEPVLRATAALGPGA